MSRKRRDNKGLDNDDVLEEGDRGVFIGVNVDGSETYFVKGDSTDENGSRGTYITYPANESRHSYLASGSFEHEGLRDSHFAAAINDRPPFEREFELESDDISDEETWNDSSRYSRNYQFTIVSPDEEMHGKAVALFDFTREHENELPLTEGQVILVSYRHGQGWLVAEDPRTGESGLVPEEFVRLVRDIEGGLTSLNGDLGPLLDDSSGAIEIGTTPDSVEQDPPMQPNDIPVVVTQSDCDGQEREPGSAETPDKDLDASQGKEKDKGKHPPVVSSFSTSSRDLDPYPPHLLTGHQHSRSTPPQIEHYDSNMTQTESQSFRRSKSIPKQRVSFIDQDKADA